MKIAAHLTRRFLPHTYTFVGNQIVTHKRYRPIVIARLHTPNTAFKIENVYFPHQYLSGIDRLKADIFYKFFYRPSGPEIAHIIKILEREEASILHFHTGLSAIYYLDLCRYIDLPKVASFYGCDTFFLANQFFRMGRRMLSRVFDKMDCILAMSEDMKKDLIKVGCPAEKIRIHYHGIDTKHFLFEKRDYRLKSKIIILQLGRLCYCKGQAFLLRSMKKVIETQKDDIEIRLVGDGPCRRRLIDLARRLSIFDKVKFLGFITYEDKRHLEEYYNADIFTYPCTTAQRYIKEGIPNGIVEAMTAGLPVISTYHAGIPEIIKDNNTGLLVQEWDEKNLAESIKRLIEDEELRKRLGQNGQAFALKNLDVHAKTAKLEDIYDSLLK